MVNKLTGKGLHYLTGTYPTQANIITQRLPAHSSHNEQDESLKYEYPRSKPGPPACAQTYEKNTRVSVNSTCSQGIRRTLHFSLDKDSEKPTVSIVDCYTNQVIRTMTSNTIDDLIKELAETPGTIIQYKV